VLLYHDILPDQVERFGRQLDRIGRIAVPTGIDELHGSPDGAWRVAVTFDDGWRSFSEQAIGELRRRGIPVALFVPSSLLVAEDAEDPGRELLTTAEVGSLAGELDAIGSHGRTHARLTRLDDAALKAELVGSRDELEHLTHRTVDSHAFPYGEWTPRVVEAAHDAGFESVYGIEPDIVRPAAQPVVPRVVVDPSDWPIEFRLKVLGAYRWMARWMDRKQRRRAVPSSELV
jgi:peptidoglycan/xylan/chitin deacetylase (PgdA/CDA1 family)